MSAFGQASEIEKESLSIILPWLKEQRVEVRLTNDQLILQLLHGDAVVKRQGDGWRTAELKAEKKHTGNLFFEVWSNRLKRTGWGVYSRAELLIYHFIDAGKIYRIDLPELQRHVQEHGDVYTTKRQRKREQKNVTEGLLLPIGKLKEALGNKFEVFEVPFPQATPE